jgi:hypothetical protein
MNCFRWAAIYAIIEDIAATIKNEGETFDVTMINLQLSSAQKRADYERMNRVYNFLKHADHDHSHVSSSVRTRRKPARPPRLTRPPWPSRTAAGGLPINARLTIFGVRRLDSNNL